MKRTLALWAFLCSSLALGQVSPPDQRRPPLSVRQRDRYVDRLKTDERIAVYQKRLAAAPESVDERLNLASAYVQKMRETADWQYLERADQLVQQVLGKDPNHYAALRQSTEIEMHRHHFPQVVELARGLAERNPGDPWNWGMLGDALMERGEYDQAGEAYGRMLSRRPDLFSYNRLAYHRFVTGHAEEALDLMSKAVAAGSAAAENVAWCLVEMGDMFLKTGRLKGAEQAYTRALDTFPGYHKAHFGLGRLQAARGESKAAIQSLKQAQAGTPLPEYAALLEYLADTSGDRQEAQKQRGLIDVADKLAQANGETANRVLGVIYADEGRQLERALSLVKAEFAVRDDVYSYDALAWVLYQLKRYPEAANASQKALRWQTPEPNFYFHAAQIARSLGKTEEAEKYLGRWRALNAKFEARYRSSEYRGSSSES